MFGPEERASLLTGWVSGEFFADPASWPDISRNYAFSIGSNKTPVGGSCALQGHASRVAALTLGVWVSTGVLLRLDRSLLLFELASGRTTQIRVDRSVGMRPDARVDDVADELLHGYLASIVDASQRTSRITDRVAWGNIAAAVAGVFRAIHAHVPSSDQPLVADLARRFLTLDTWPEHELISWTEPNNTVLWYHRSTCCLMRLSPEKSECGSCSKLTHGEQLDRWSAAAPALVTFPLRVSDHVRRE